MEIQLANKLGVSRTPIREAIRKLELEGLVLMIPDVYKRQVFRPNPVQVYHRSWFCPFCVPCII